jgi:hypothetical protein
VAALSAAAPGAVIAVDGVIEVSGFHITTPDLTLTCATPGSGLRVRALGGFLMHVSAPRVTVERLTLDASASDFGAYIAHNDPPNARFAEDIRLLGNTVVCGATPFCVVAGGFPGGPALRGALVAGNRFEATGSPESALHFHMVDDARVERNTFVGAAAYRGLWVLAGGGLVASQNGFTGSWARPFELQGTVASEILSNTVTCGSENCLLAIGTAGLVVADNRFEAAGSAAGVHLEAWSANARVERNAIIATAAAPPGSSPSGIAVTGPGGDVAVIANGVTGPWVTSVTITSGARVSIAGNRLEGAQAYGVRFARDPASGALPVENQVRDNVIARAGVAGVLVAQGCGNQFVDNRLQRNPVGLIFDVETGANRYVGNPAIVVDNGNYDCNGDGVADPNRIMVPSAGGCPTTADVVVRNWDELRAAVAAASPGTVIAVDGMFEATVIEIWTPDVTITCATPGSGLRAPWGFMFRVFAPRVTIERLTLDASAVGSAVYLAHQGGPDAGHAEEVRLIGNTINCGPGDYCVVYGSFPGGPVARGALVVGNRFTATGSRSALHFHGVEGARVEGNTFLGAGARQGIRVQGEDGLLISDNVLAGSWVDPLVLEFAEGSQILNNSVACGSGVCLFGIGTPGIVVAGNRFESGGSATGVHLQGNVTGARVERNTIVATVGSGGESLGGIRVRDGSNVVVAGNVVRGPWRNSIAVTNLASSRFERNRLEGAELYGVLFGAVLMSDNAFESNEVTGAGSAGIFAQWACRNTFLGNRLDGNGQVPSVIFEATTGANVLVVLGNTGDVIDNGGGFDCNGDGIADPNTIGGPGRVMHGVAIGRPPDDPGAAASGKLR